jgi:site-specific DNA-methyltransferase (adenine-specific)
MTYFNLIKGDCLQEMKNIADNSVDMILCDLPYGTTACKWDSIIRFDTLWEQYNRIIKKNGAIVLFGKEPFSSNLRMSAIDIYKYDWIWKKTRKNGFVHAKGRPLQETENICVFSFGDVYAKSHNKMKYFPQGVIPFSAERINYVKTTSAYRGGMAVGSKWTQDGCNYPTEILTFSSVSPKIQNHPTQKPVDLLEYLIKTYTNEGDTVLDNTMGSGSTGVAALNTNRKFIGIEKDDIYFEIAQNRINEIKNKTTLEDFLF